MKFSNSRMARIREKLFKLYPHPDHPMRVQWRQYRASCYNDDGGNSTEHWRLRRAFLKSIEEQDIK